MPHSQSRSRKRLRLDVASAKTVPLLDDSPFLPWPVAAFGGGISAVLAGALITCAVVLIGWTAAMNVPVSEVLALAARVWLLANGGGLVLDGLRVSLVPLGLSSVLIGLCVVLGGWAYRQASLARRDAAQGRERTRLVLLIAALFAIGYLLSGIGVAALVGSPAFSAAPGSLLIASSGALIGAGWRAGYRISGPLWLRAALRGAAAGLAGLVLASVAALAVALVQGESRIATLEQQLGFDTSGAVVWALISLLYLPNLLGWSLAWLLGAGFTLGSGSLIAPWTTQLGMLPAVPVFGALPKDGSAGMQAWLVAGVLIGAVAGVAAARWARGEVGSTVGSGAASGLLVGIGYLGWTLASAGALGSDRFAAVGPRWPHTLIGVGILVAAAALAATGAWFAFGRAGTARLKPGRS